ncbi:protein LRATD1-like [Patiria miniata]|uniref:LRAT domain-containing protein n=1 Tax=Patiria miniata TaxID=46514 RepID=A0A914AKI3_PATMI|nr:protein LRATD1-like [Patiria miniata]
MGNVQNRFTSVDKVLLKCEPGDLIEILHPHSSFNHWAVYVGEGTVIHVRQPWIRRESLQSAAGLGRENYCAKLVRINNYKHIRVLKQAPQSAQKIVESAKEQLGMEWYNMQFYGCEMFAVRCRFGVKVDIWKEFYKSTEIERPSDTAVALSNPLVTYGHQQHEF